MSANAAIVKRLEQRAQQADQIIARLKSQLGELKKTAISASGVNDINDLQDENTRLHADIKNALNKLVALETSNGVIQIPMPKSCTSQASTCNSIPGSGVNSVKGQTSGPVEGQGAADQAKPDEAKPAKKKQAKTEKKGDKKVKTATSDVPASEPNITVVDLRIGVILEVKRHPDADTLYIEQIDVGENSTRTVVSGLVNNVPIEEMQNRLVVLCCNLKPAKMRGILSQAMVMCACTADKVEILIPPEGVVPGDRVSCEGMNVSGHHLKLPSVLVGDYPPQMNPKKKIFEQIKPHLKTDTNRVACYKGSPFKVEGKGVCVTPSLVDAQVR